MNLCRACYLVVPLFLALVALVLSIFALAGSANNNAFLTNIFLFEMNFTTIDLAGVIGTAQPSLSSVVSEISGSLGTGLHREMGLSDIYTIGMWGYCKGNMDGTDSGIDPLSAELLDTHNVNFTYCSSPRAMYEFEPIELVKSQISLNDSSIATVLTAAVGESTTQSLLQAAQGELESAIEDAIPSSIKDQLDLVKTVSRLIFLTTLIGILITFIGVLLSFCACFSRCASCILFLVSLMGTVSLFIGATSSTVMYRIVRDRFNDAFQEFGMSSGLSRMYLAFYWAAVAAAILSSLLWLLTICCCTPSRRRVVPMEEKPMMTYVSR